MDNDSVFIPGNVIFNSVIQIPKYIAFDIGNVLCHVDLTEFQDHLVDIGIFESSEKALYFAASIQASQDLGMCDIKQEFGRYFSKLSEKQLEGIKDSWLNTIKPSEEMFELLHELYSRGWSIALLSNIGIDHAKKVRQEYPILNDCYQHFSFEVGARKPTNLYYQSFILKNPHWLYSLTGNFFFDDRKENIDAAKGYFNSVLFDLNSFSNDQEAADFVREIIRKS
jgi:FMN phosphatase YigB (HAD superfamily)